MTARIDLNGDIGESFGAWTMGDDAGVLESITSANIACGFHAGDPFTMQATVAAAVARGVALGAHPSLPDLQGFGRRELRISPNEAYALTLYQTGALAAFATAAGSALRHVKPHGALYNMAARDAALSMAIATAVRDCDASLILVGLSGSALPAAGEAMGLRVAHEAFVDRRYRADGSLVPRGAPGAVIDAVDASVEQAIRLAVSGVAIADEGSPIALRVDTLCLHGDRADAAGFARSLRASLVAAGVTIGALAG